MGHFEYHNRYKSSIELMLFYKLIASVEKKHQQLFEALRLLLL